jgi:uncharacterized protein YoxC
VEFSIYVSIAIIVGFLAFAALCVYAIIILTHLRKSIIKIQEDVQEVSRSAVPLVENLKIITDKLRNISENVDDQITVLRSSVDSIREMTENIVSFERDLQRQVEGPVMEAVSFVAAVVKAVKVFIAKMKE